MTIKNIVIDQIHGKFPEQINLIKELFDESESFRTLCEDYVECQSVIERLRYDIKIMEQHALNEYLQLSAELEEEIRTWLQVEFD